MDNLWIENLQKTTKDIIEKSEMRENLKNTIRQGRAICGGDKEKSRNT